MHAIVQWLENLNIKRNMTSMFVNKKHRYTAYTILMSIQETRLNRSHHFFPFSLAAINNALRYNSIVTARRIAYVIGFIWTLSLVVAVFPFLGWREARPRILGGYCQYHLNLARSYILFLHVTVCLTPLTITCLAYCKIFQVARMQAQKIASMTVRFVECFFS